ncbi:MAG: hypothetical protein IPM48_01205 [Saprospiraceae bacterium]|nr:hypothetical protein [Saprospiraceae bacterium]
MDFQSIRKLIRKFEQILELYADHEELSSSERDLMLDYVRRIYQQIQLLKTAPEDLSAIHNFEAKLQSSESLVENNKRSVSPPQHLNSENNSILTAHPKVETINETGSNENSETDLLEKYKHLFDCLKISDLSEKLELIPIKDLKSGIGLNERILAQNELFAGDKEFFNRTLTELDGCGDLQNAKMYLVKNVIPTFQWDRPEKEKFVDSFLKLIQRRFLN